jgi:uncharacterized glyoxalase superfamily protein PhnB
MLVNRSMPQSAVIPELPYPDIGAAIDWLAAAFGFTLRLRIGDHRAQLNAGDGTVVLTERSAGDENVSAVLVRVDDIDAHHARSSQHGARIVRPPADHPYGERQYAAIDPAGHRWTFSQSIFDIAPEDWGGTSGQLS